MSNLGPMAGRICLVTGATSGIGTVTARELVRAGATVLAVGRDSEKLDRIKKEVLTATGADRLETFKADLSVQAEVKALAESVRARHQQLHVLVNNAGALYTERHESRDGLELTFALNHMAYFLLTHHLRDLLVAGAPARIVNVSSRAHYSGSMKFDDLQGKSGSFGGWGAYCQSKLANVLFTAELARQLEGTRVVANSLHPGVVYTSIGQNNGWKGVIIGFLFRFFGISADEGARTTLHLAMSGSVEGVTGKYFDKCREVRPSRESQDPVIASRLWSVSQELGGIPNVATGND